jgi:hypothetical protein
MSWNQDTHLVLEANVRRWNFCLKVCLMNSYRTALFAFALIIVAAFVTTFVRVDTSQVANDRTPPGTTGLARPHPPLDRSPSQPVFSAQ